jgi:hypothetical protein
MKPVRHTRMQAQEQRRDQKCTHYLWREMGESLDEVRERFRRMVEEGRADGNDDYIILQWNW